MSQTVLSTTEPTRAAPAHGEWASFLRYRGLMAELIRRDLRERYAGSVVGTLWTVIHPLIMVVVYIVVFSTIMGDLRGRQQTWPYAVYLCSALIPWMLFQETVGRCSGCFVAYGGMMKKAAFPKSILPLTVGVSSLVAFVVMFLVFMIYLGFQMAFSDSALPLDLVAILGMLALVALQQILAIGLGFGLGVLNVFFRDTEQVVAVVLQVLFWASPIIWFPDQFDKYPTLFKILKCNPLYPFMELYHRAFVPESFPGDAGWALPLALFWTILAVVFGVVVYRRLRHQIVDQL